MRALAFAILLIVAVRSAPVAQANPDYVSCRDGTIVLRGQPCPPYPKPRTPPDVGVGHGGSRGLLGLGIGGIL